MTTALENGSKLRDVKGNPKGAIRAMILMDVGADKMFSCGGSSLLERAASSLGGNRSNRPCIIPVEDNQDNDI